MAEVIVADFRSDDRGSALSQAAAWCLVNGNRFDVVTFVGDASKCSVFYIDTQEPAFEIGPYVRTN